MIHIPTAVELTVSELVGKLEAGDWHALIGQPESLQIDFKGAPYVLTEKRERFELAKDVSALANAQGGILILGVETELTEVRQGEFASAVNPFPSHRVDVKQYRDVVRELIYPEVNRLEVRQLPSADDALRSVAYILVPPQQDQPFILTKVFLEEPKDKLSGMLVGYFVRRASDTVALTRERLHDIIRSGVRYDNAIQERFDRLETRLDEMQAIRMAVRKLSPAERVDASVMAVVAAMDLTEKPAFVLCAVPDRDHDFLPLIETPSAAGSRLIEHPPSLRANGFDLETGQAPRLVAGQTRRAEGYGRKTLELSRNGVLLFISSGDEDFLCWRKRLAGTRLRVNPLVVAEVTYLFCELVRQIYALASLSEDPVHIALVVDHAFDEAGDMTLAPGSLDDVAQLLPFSQHSAPGARFERWVEVPASADPGACAYKLVKELYLWFGLDDPTAIPYTEGEQHAFSRRLLVAAGRS